MIESPPRLEELERVAAELETAPPEQIVRWAVGRYEPAIALATSFGAEDMVLLDMLARIQERPRAFFLDTGLHFPETYALRDRVVAAYPQLDLEVIRPRLTVEQQERAFGPALWRRDPDRCCALRKVEPLERALRPLSAWVTGLRREQAPTRRNIRVVEWDRRHGLVKVNPLARWRQREVWRYIREHGLPYNPLHDRGYPSIGCQPCTSPVADGEDPRAGRWRGLGKTECGLHV
ncbi:MAG: phosphoadenylyl-sulfate reductase [Bacillota bacterium]|nr:phosphoadenylyl-sulfate reductase [Bacillota bacterium]